MIASAATITAMMMMMIPDADGSDHPTTLATISPRLACAKP
jgi:hypothetical protein